VYIQAWAVAYLYLGALPEPVLLNKFKSSHAFPFLQTKQQNCLSGNWGNNKDDYGRRK